VETTKALVHDLDLPMFLWVETCNIVVYILNSCPRRILKDKAPDEAFTNEKPQVSHFHVFNCPVHTHIPKQKKTKLEPSSLKGVFIGYSESLRVTESTFPHNKR
jgi:hypothetical protein